MLSHASPLATGGPRFQRALSRGVFARNEGRRIVYYRLGGKTRNHFWDAHWKTHTVPDLKAYYRPFHQGYLGHGQLQRVFLQHLPRAGAILEAGCGMANYVVALRARGYNCSGIDFAKETVARVRAHLPGCPVRTGDVGNLDLPEESLDAYISLGVMEHFREGPQAPLREAARVLKQGGILIVSVPQASAWRKRYDAWPENTELPPEAIFYQYAFEASEFGEFLEGSGFRIVKEYGLQSHFAFRIRFPLAGLLLERFPRLAHVDLLLDRTALGRTLGRMRLYVATKDALPRH